MIDEYRDEFNARFTERAYRRFRERLDDRIGQNVEFHVAESPVFIPKALQEECEAIAIELSRAAHDPDYLRRSDVTLSPAITVPNQPERATFLSVDFALTLEDGRVVPKLVELQGFPSVAGFQLFCAELMLEHWRLPPELGYVCGACNYSRAGLVDLLRRAIVADADPEQVILLELDPWRQKTSPDFRAIQELLGIAVVDIRTVSVREKRFHYRRSGRTIPVERVFNRAIVDEIERTNAVLPFNWSDPIDVAWAGHPNWYFRISKFTLPFLDHPAVPRARFLSDVSEFPENLDDYVLKPLYSFAGTGVIVGPTREDLDAIPEGSRSEYLLQERITFAPIIQTPHGGTKAELRVMLIWPDDEKDPLPAINLIRLSRGDKMGAGQNLTLPWTGPTCSFFV